MTDSARRRRRALWCGRALVDLGAIIVVLAAAVAIAALVTGEGPSASGWSVAPVLAAAAVAAACWTPLRSGTHRAARQLLDGTTRDPHDVVRSFGRRASRDLADDDVLVELCEALVRVFRAASAEVWREVGGGRFDLAVSVPQVERSSWQLSASARRPLEGGVVVGRAWLEMWHPLLLEDRPAGEIRLVGATHAGAVLGLVVVTRLPGGDRYTTDEDASLAELGTRLGVVLHNRELDATLRDALEDLRHTNAELRASRVRLVATADAERRRIERDLHDGAQQHLAALAVNLRLAADEIAAHPESGPSVFDALGGDVLAAIHELRALAHGIYPPLLLDSGLVEALSASARRAPSVVDLEVGRVRRYTSEVEAAVYFCCMEALQNASKHAPAAPVRLVIGETDDALTFEVIDAGPGLREQSQGGHGLTNMADRVGAVGGRLTVTTGVEGGTVVTGIVPLELALASERPPAEAS